MNSIKVGIIGCGSITRFRHAPEYADNPYVDEIIFYDRNTERSQALADEFGGRIAKSVEELWNDPEIVAVSDCSSNETHHIITSTALRKGKHVLCEKPLAVSVEKAEQMIKAQQESGRKLMVDHNQRFSKAHQKAKEWIASKELGDVLTFKTSFGHQGPEHWGVNQSNATWFFKKDRSHSGVAGDLGVHKIDLIHYLLDDEIVDVQSFRGALDKMDENGNPIEVCDNVVSVLRTKKGRLGTASFSWTYYGSEDNSTTIYCKKGILKIYHDAQNQLIVETKDGEIINYQLEPIQTNDNQTSTGVIDAFVDAIIHDKEPAVTGKDALSSLKVLEQMLK
ncbi:Predicted dehydrogenase [Salinibacillus kushneri]|uniref:Predicted dehydrogenase n=1 Tax=Salinibacillus kushneri TaxID=237682 RepID=A0A1H9YTN9_9BACI|nr:Gfo/Idh/MocA family oxidoreductase [Salinibacillus kushneri]SES72536.1 Predicted dehydrogenase [Salinibacillus kushneri]